MNELKKKNHNKFNEASYFATPRISETRILLPQIGAQKREFVIKVKIERNRRIIIHPVLEPLPCDRMTDSSPWAVACLLESS